MQEARRRRAAVVTALGLEFAAVTHHLSDLRDDPHPEGSAYRVGEFRGNDDVWEVAAVEVGAGNPQAAVETERIVQHFDPELVLFVGVAGGVKGVVRGDIVVASKTYDLHAGKAADDFEARPTALEPSYRLLELAKAVRRCDSWRERLDPVHAEPSAAVHLGPIAAGQQVIASKRTEIWESLQTTYSDALAVDMESAGFMRAIHARNDLPALVIRGVSDLIDGKTEEADHDWQPKAAARAAAFGMELLARYRGADRDLAHHRVVRMPPISGPFAGRSQELTALAEGVRNARETHGLAAHVLHGLGGMGKTRLVSEFARRHAGDYHVVWLVRGDDALTRASDLAELAAALGLPEADEAEQSLAVVAAKRWLQANDRWLLMLDDFPDPATVADLLPDGPLGDILVTSRHEGGWREVAVPVRLDVLHRDDSKALLREHSGDDDDAGADQVAETLGDLPLALAQAAAYVDVTGISLSAYLDRFRRASEELLGRGAPRDYESTVATTWSLAFGEVGQKVPAVIVLSCLALCAPQAVPRDIFLAGGIDDSPFAGGDGAVVLDEAVSELLRFSLVSADRGTIEMHRLVQYVVRQRLEPEEAKGWVRSTQILLEQSFPVDVETPAFWEECNALLPHAMSAGGHAGDLGCQDDVTAALLYRVARYLRARYALDAAEKAITRALKLKETTEGESRDVVATLVELSGIQAARGRLQDAKDGLERALRIEEAHVGAEAPEAAGILSNLGSMFRQLGQPEEAEKRLARALGIIEAHVGPNDPQLISPLVNLANAQDDLGKTKESRRRLERALAIAEEQLDAADPTIAKIMTNLGSRLMEDGEVEEAARYQLTALEHYESAFGPDYPGLGPVLVNAGLARLRLGDPAGAKADFERALAVEIGPLGDDHPEVAKTLLNLAKAERALGEFPEARAAAERAVEIAEQSPNATDIDRVGATVELADVLRIEGRDLEGAERAARRTIELADRAYGRSHPQYAFALRTLGTVLRQQALAQESVDLARQSYDVQVEALTILERVLGKESAEVCWTLCNIGNLLVDVGDTGRARTVFEEARRIASVVFGEKTRDYGGVLAGLANACLADGDDAQARALERRALELDPSLGMD